MVKVSAVPPRRSTGLTIIRDASAINDGTTAEPRRSWRCDCGLCRTSTAVAPRLRCDGGIRCCLSVNYFQSPYIIAERLNASQRNRNGVGKKDDQTEVLHALSELTDWMDTAL